MLAGSETRSRVKTTASAAAPSARCASCAASGRLGRHRDRGERRLLLGLLLGAVLVEAVGAQRGAESELGGRLGRRQPGAPSPRSIAKVASLSPAPFRCATSLPPRSCSSRASTASGLPRPARTMRLSGRFGGPMIGSSSFFLPWKRGAAATARVIAPPVASSSRRAGAVRTRSSHTPTTTAPA